MKTDTITFGKIGDYLVMHFGEYEESKDSIDLYMTPDGMYAMFEPLERFKLPEPMCEVEFGQWIEQGGREILNKKYEEVKQKYGLKDWPESDSNENDTEQEKEDEEDVEFDNDWDDYDFWDYDEL